MGSTGLSGLRQGEDSVSVPLRSRIHHLGAAHSVSVLSLDDEDINNVQVAQLLKTWSASLADRLDKVEDYVASFIAFLETADIRMFPSQGEGSWSGSSMSWLLENASYELVSDFFNSDEELLSLFRDSGTARSIPDLSRMHDIFLRLLDEKIDERYRLGISYTSFPLSLSVSFFQENLDQVGFDRSWVSTLASAFQVQLTTNFGVEDSEDFPLSEKFIESLVHYCALLVCTRLSDSERGAVLTFVGYGEKQTYPVVVTIVIDGFLLKVQYYSLKLDDHAYWAGEGFGSSDLADAPEIDVAAEHYPLWCHSLDSNRPVKLLTIGGTGLSKAWKTGISDSMIESIESKISSENSEDQEASTQAVLDQFSSTIEDLRRSREYAFNERARSLDLRGQTHVVESLLRLEAYNALNNEGENAILDMGTPIQVFTLVPGQGPVWLKDEL